MRFILEFTVSDNCTYWYTSTLPIVADSKEAVFVAVMDGAMAALKDGQGEFNVFGHELPVESFYSRCEGKYQDLNYVKVDGRPYIAVEPRIMTLDEFFAEQPAESAA